jgi:hypothetical protein
MKNLNLTLHKTVGIMGIYHPVGKGGRVQAQLNWHGSMVDCSVHGTEPSGPIKGR